MNTLLSRMRPAVLPLVVMLIGAVIAVWFVASRPRALPKPPQEQVWPVPVIDVSAADVRPVITVFGEVRAAREAELRAMVAGRLVELDPTFRNGSYIAAGAELAVIDPVDYENQLQEQRAELARAAAQLARQRKELEWELELEKNALRQVELAARALERTEQLAASGRESRKVRDEAATTLALSEQTRLQRAQNVARLRVQIEEQQATYDIIQTNLAAAERDLAHTRVIAPFSGYVTDVRLALGQRLAIGEALGRLLSATEMEVRFELPEADFARLLDDAGERAQEGLRGRQLEVVWHLGEHDQTFAAELARVGAEIDPALGGIELYATLAADAAEHGLRAGAFVEIRLPDIVYHDVYRLPAKALTADGEAYQLVDERLAPVAVDVVRNLGEEVLVRGAFDPGRPVVARVFGGIGPGLRVKPL
ncbi:MAG: HlyD family efflux transporter periplasmic adaptor subunit [Gammaproteobacteria bacterium]